MPTCIGSCHTPALGYLALGLRSHSHKVGYPKKGHGKWYEATGSLYTYFELLGALGYRRRTNQPLLSGQQIL